MQLDLSLTVGTYYFFSISRRILLLFIITVVFGVVLDVAVDVAFVLVLIVKFHIVKDSFPPIFFNKRLSFLDKLELVISFGRYRYVLC